MALKAKSIHYLSGISIAVFVVAHLLNHLVSIFGAEAHLQLMDVLRVVYRNIVVEAILLLAIVFQIVTGIKLFLTKRKRLNSSFEKLQIWTGLYLAAFFCIHLSAVILGRFLLELDTNFYFGVAGLNTFPLSLFFVPYYGLAMLAFFGHIASIHNKKMKKSIGGWSPNSQAKFILIVGIITTLSIFYGLTNGFSGVEIPEEYEILIGK